MRRTFLARAGLAALGLGFGIAATPARAQDVNQLLEGALRQFGGDRGRAEQDGRARYEEQERWRREGAQQERDRQRRRQDGEREGWDRRREASDRERAFRDRERNLEDQERRIAEERRRVEMERRRNW